MPESLEARIARVELMQQDFKDQQGRFASHLRSEQRVYNAHGVTLGLMKNIVERMDEDIKEHKKMLVDGENGLSIRVDRLEQSEKGNKNRFMMLLTIITVTVTILNFLKGILL